MQQPQATSVPNRKHKKRTFDIKFPEQLAKIIPDISLYDRLVAAEQKIDSIIMRKNIEIQDAAFQPKGSPQMITFDISTDVSVQGWSSRKITSVLKGVAVVYNDPNTLQESAVQWVRTTNIQDSDGFVMRRNTSMSSNARLILKIENTPERFRLSPALSKAIGLTIDTQSNVLFAVWSYIKANRLQDVHDKKIIINDDVFIEVFKVPKMSFSMLPELIQQHLTPLEPIAIPLEFSENQFNTKVEVLAFLQDPIINDYREYATKALQIKDTIALDEKISQILQVSHKSKVKREFMEGFSQDPTVLGEITPEFSEAESSEFYEQDWVRDLLPYYTMERANSSLRNSR
ncbi:hypothetical protein ROZALSC1DRAFT_27649 [Rozella allomycis CSF55]|uniref:DM2 domain-containing protein n=1 Tax=Rozella allomycis (strain CSF55) TaxID=988480 RepID=A0A4P9YPC9_ROZAC|nr:hypothetical protein ROZALSC1DRAFT_27649 [Rozella allomycis CSF55]